MKRKNLILTLVVTLLFTISLGAQAKPLEPYNCYHCGSYNVTSTVLHYYTEVSYIYCICHGQGGGVSSEYDKVEQRYAHMRDDCEECGIPYFYDVTAGYKRTHIGENPR